MGQGDEQNNTDSRGSAQVVYQPQYAEGQPHLRVQTQVGGQPQFQQNPPQGYVLQQQPVAAPQGQPVFYYAAPQQAQNQQVYVVPAGQGYPAPYGGAQPTIIVKQHSSVDWAANSMRASMICYFLTFWFFIPHAISVAYSLHMVRRGWIVRKRNEVLAFSILELIAFAFVCGFSWFFEEYCYTSYYGYYDYYNYCYVDWLGWISFVVWGVFVLAFGIPRIMFTWNYDGSKQQQQQQQVVYAQPAPAPAMNVVYSTQQV